MARKPGPKKGSKQRRKKDAQNEASTGTAARSGRSAGTGGTARHPQAPNRDESSGRDTDKRPAGSRLGALFNSPAVRKVMAATLVSAAGALLFNKRGGDRDKQPTEDDLDASKSPAPASDTAKRSVRGTGTGTRKGTRSPAPATDAADPLVAAGVAGELAKKKRTAGRGRKPKAETPSILEPSMTEAGPGAYPDGSPVGDTAGRTSVEGGSGDHTR